MVPHTASAPWANTPRPRTGQSPAVTRPKFTDTEPAGDDWRKQAACRGQDPDRWFPLSYVGPSIPDVLATKAVCREQCPVRSECLRVAMLAGCQDGIFGGLDPEERKAIKRKRDRNRQQQARRAAS